MLAVHRPCRQNSGTHYQYETKVADAAVVDEILGPGDRRDPRPGYPLTASLQLPWWITLPTDDGWFHRVAAAGKRQPTCYGDLLGHLATRDRQVIYFAGQKAGSPSPGPGPVPRL